MIPKGSILRQRHEGGRVGASRQQNVTEGVGHHMRATGSMHPFEIEAGKELSQTRLSTSESGKRAHARDYFVVGDHLKRWSTFQGTTARRGRL